MSKIDTSKFEGYENLTAEEKLALLEGYEFTDATPDYSGYVKKDLFDKLSHQYAELKRQSNANKSEQELKEQERREELESMKSELEDLKTQKAISENKANFISLGYDEALAGETATAMVSGDMAKVLANQKIFQENYRKQIEEEILKKTPRPKAGASNENVITKEQFSKMSIKERSKLKEESPDLYNALTK